MLISRFIKQCYIFFKFQGRYKGKVGFETSSNSSLRHLSVQKIMFQRYLTKLVLIFSIIGLEQVKSWDICPSNTIDNHNNKIIVFTALNQLGFKRIDYV